jgi:hypothetical protein
MRLITETGNYEIQLFAGFVADASEAAVWQIHFASNDTYMNWISSLFERSTFKSYVELTPSDRIVTLSTCTYDFTGARYVVMGKLVLVSGEDSKPEVPSGGENSAAGSEPPAGTGESDGVHAGTEETPPAEISPVETAPPQENPPPEETYGEPPAETPAEETPPAETTPETTPSGEPTPATPTLNLM